MRKKSKYKPKTVRPDNLSWVLSGMRSVASVPKAGVGLLLANSTAMDAIIKGEGTGVFSHTLREAFSMAVQMPKVRASLGADWLPELNAALEATNAMHERGERTGRFLFTGPEMQLVKVGMEIHTQQINECTVKEMEQSIHLCITSKAYA